MTHYRRRNMGLLAALALVAALWAVAGLQPGITPTPGGPGTDTTAIHTGDAAGGGLGGTYPNPTVDPQEGSSILSTGEAASTVLKSDGDDSSSWATLATLGAIDTSTAGQVYGLPSTTGPVSGDIVLLEDSQAANAKTHDTIGNVLATLAIDQATASQIYSLPTTITPATTDVLLLEDADNSYAKGKATVQGILNLVPAGSGAVVQVVTTVSNTEATGTTQIPVDDTDPQNTEGDEYLTCTITPTSATNRLAIRADVSVLASTAVTITTSLFQDTAADALNSTCVVASGAGAPSITTFLHDIVAGTTSATTFKIRCGPNAPATLYVNRGTGGGRFNNNLRSFLTITEYTP